MFKKLFSIPKKKKFSINDYNKTMLECRKYLRELESYSKGNCKNMIKYLKKKDIYISNFNSLYGYSIYINSLDKLKNGLDIGCSYGIKTLLLSKLTNSNVLGVDISESVINHANELLKSNEMKKKNRFIKSSNLNNIKKTFDWITAMGLISNCSSSNLKLILKNCYDLLNPHGLLMLHCGSNSLNKQEALNTMNHHIFMEIGNGTINKPKGIIFKDRYLYLKKTYKFASAISHELALNMCYYDKKKIDKCIMDYINLKKMPNSKFETFSKTKVPVHLNGIPARTFNNPYKIKNLLKSLNFHVFFKKHYPSYDIVRVWNEKKYVENSQSFFIIAKKK